MTRRVGFWVLLGSLLVAHPSAAQWAVLDIDSLRQSIQEYKLHIQKYTEMVEQTRRQVEMIRNQIQQIEYAYTTVEHGVTNLMKLDFNGAEDLLNLHRTLNGKIRQAERIGYTAETTWGRAEALYPKIQGVMDAGAQQALHREWAATKREAGQVAIATQAIAASHEEQQRKWQDILNAAYAAQGHLQAQQATVQAQGVIGSQLMEMSKQMATQARHESLKVLEEASRTEMEQTAIQHVTTEVNTVYQHAGRRLKMTTTGRE